MEVQKTYKSSEKTRERAKAWALSNRERRREIQRDHYWRNHERKFGLPALDRFEKSIERIPESGCWLWTCALNRNGYGKVKVDGRHLTAHRWSWAIHNGTVPEGMWVLHRCDVPACVNPTHLFLGDVQKNVDDMWAKGRRGAMRGGSLPNEKNPNCSFSDEEISAIRAARKVSPETNKALAKRFGISETHFSHIVRGLVRRARHV